MIQGGRLRHGSRGTSPYHRYAELSARDINRAEKMKKKDTEEEEEE